MVKLAAQLKGTDTSPKKKSRGRYKKKESERKMQLSNESPKKLSTERLTQSLNHFPEEVKTTSSCEVCALKDKKAKKKVKRTYCNIVCMQCNQYVHNGCWNDHINM